MKNLKRDHLKDELVASLERTCAIFDQVISTYPEGNFSATHPKTGLQSSKLKLVNVLKAAKDIR